MGEYKRHKLEELILYVTWKRPEDRQLGVAHLARVLFEVDFGRYRRAGDSITGSTYIATQHGPMPEGLQATIDRMRDLGWIKGDTVADNGDHPIQQLKAVHKPNRAVFTPEEIAQIDGILAGDLGEYAQQFIGWQNVPEGKPIPYGTALLSRPTLTPDEIAFGLALSEQLASQRER